MTRDELLGANGLGLVAGANHRIKVMVAGDNQVGIRCDRAIGERKTLLTRQIAFEPLPASVLFGLGCSW